MDTDTYTKTNESKLDSFTFCFSRVHGTKCMNSLISIWFLVITWGIIVACTAQESTLPDLELTANDTTIQVSDGTAITTAEPTATTTPTPILPSPTATAVLPTPTATEALPTVEATPTPVPVALCPVEAEPELTWTCEENSRDGVRYCTAVDQEQQFACYEDLTHTFALSLVNDWAPGFVVVSQHPPYPERDKVVKYHDILLNNDNEEFEDAWIRLYVFVPRERNLSDWLASKHRVSPDVYPITETNASVAGHPATIWIYDCSPQFYRDVQVVVHNGDRVFEWRHHAYREAGIVALRQLLDSIRFSEETGVPAEIPDELWQEVLQGCW